MGEPLPLATIHDAVLQFLRGRDDAVLYGAQAVNAYVDEPRMTQDVDIMSTRAPDLAEEIRVYLNQRFHIATRVREVRGGIGYRIEECREARDRILIKVKKTEYLPPAQRIFDVLVLTPVELMCTTVVDMARHPDSPQGFIELADLRRLLLTFPELRSNSGPVRDRLEAMVADGAIPVVLELWQKLVLEEIESEDEDAKFAWGRPKHDDQGIRGSKAWHWSARACLGVSGLIGAFIGGLVSFGLLMSMILGDDEIAISGPTTKPTVMASIFENIMLFVVGEIAAAFAIASLLLTVYCAVGPIGRLDEIRTKMFRRAATWHFAFFGSLILLGIVGGIVRTAIDALQ